MPVVKREVLFEGLRAEEILSLPQEEISQLIFLGEPVVFKIGSATLLGSFRKQSEKLVVELAHIDGGGEGVLISLGALARRYAALHKISTVEWIVHAVACAKPNLKLRHLLERRGFRVEEIAGIGQAYHFVDCLT